MMAKAHMIVGATSWAVYHHYAPPFSDATLLQIGTLMTACAFAALLPDVDHPSSTLGQLISPVSKLISMMFGHRGFTHSLLALFGVIYVLGYMAPEATVVADVIDAVANKSDPMQNHDLWITVISIGYLSHLLGDVITPAGLPLLYPFKKRFTTPYTIKAGGPGEGVVVLTYGLFAAALYTKWHVHLYQHVMTLVP
jgi:inner membrane protein